MECGYLERHLNIDYQELEQFTEKTQLQFGSGIVNPPLPVASSISPAQFKVAAPSNALPSKNHSVFAPWRRGGDPGDSADKRWRQGTQVTVQQLDVESREFCHPDTTKECRRTQVWTCQVRRPAAVSSVPQAEL